MDTPDLLVGMRDEIEALAVDPRVMDDEELHAAVRRLLDAPDDENEQFYSDLRRVTLFKLRLQFEAERGDVN